MLDIINHLFSQLRISQTLQHFISASVMHPWRKDYTQHRASGHIWVLVEGNTDALLLSLFQKLDNLINLIPVLFTAYLEMGVVNPYARLTADFNNFFHRIEDGICLTSLVDDKKPVVLCHHLTHLNDFPGLGICTGHINQAR